MSLSCPQPELEPSNAACPCYPQVVSRRSKRLKKPSYGGSWRAWVRKHTADTKGRPDLRALAARYWDAKAGGPEAASLQQCVAMGNAASLQGKQIGNTAFGVNRRQVRKNTLALAVTALEHQLHGQSLPVQVDEIVKLANRLRGHCDAVKLCGLLARRQAEAQRIKNSRDQKILLDFDNSIGKQHVASLKESFPELDVKGFTFHAIPANKLSWFMVTTPAVKDAVTATAKMFSPQAGSLGGKVSSCWQRLHDVVEPSLCQPMASLKREQGPSKCWQHNFCICCNKGKVVHRMRNKFLKMLKQVFKFGEMKELLLAGSIMAKFSLKDTSGDVGSASAHSNVEVHEDSLFLHIPLLYLSPYRATFHLVHETENPEAWLGYPTDKVIYVKVQTYGAWWVMLARERVLVAPFPLNSQISFKKLPPQVLF